MTKISLSVLSQNPQEGRRRLNSSVPAVSFDTLKVINEPTVDSCYTAGMCGSCSTGCQSGDLGQRLQTSPLMQEMRALVQEEQAKLHGG